MSKYQFKDGDNVLYRYHYGEDWKTGIIRGVATTEQPVIGCIYIVQDTSGLLPTEQYPFTSMPVMEVNILKNTHGVKPVKPKSHYVSYKNYKGVWITSNFQYSSLDEFFRQNRGVTEAHMLF